MVVSAFSEKKGQGAAKTSVEDQSFFLIHFLLDNLTVS